MKQYQTARQMLWCMVGALAALTVALVIGSCSFKQSKPIPTPTPTVETPVKINLKMPTFKCVGCTFNERYTKAFQLMAHANSDDFESYFLKKRITLSHVDGMHPEAVIKIFRMQLSQGHEIPVIFYWAPWSSGIGAWDVNVLKQNTKFTYAPAPLAAHLLHEVAHFYKWTHVGNKKYEFNNFNSFPYAIGDEFKAYLLEKGL